jgi:hypothetical protein
MGTVACVIGIVFFVLFGISIQMASPYLSAHSYLDSVGFPPLWLIGFMLSSVIGAIVFTAIGFKKILG